jgi:site-specific DNA-methyltransferase (adenine-specific)
MRALIPDESIQLTVTSPPYDNLRTYNGFTWDFPAVARELYRVTKPGGVAITNDRDFIGIEISAEYLTIAKNRIG